MGVVGVFLFVLITAGTGMADIFIFFYGVVYFYWIETRELPQPDVQTVCKESNNLLLNYSAKCREFSLVKMPHCITNEVTSRATEAVK